MLFESEYVVCFKQQQQQKFEHTHTQNLALTRSRGPWHITPSSIFSVTNDAGILYRRDGWPL